jgi:phage-related protein (TIGR01555 family)
MVERYRRQGYQTPQQASAAYRPGRASIKKETIKRAAREGKELRKAAAGDSFVNYALNLGMGANNALSSSTYGFNPITRIRTLLDWVHRGAWIGGVAIDLLADDMTRGGVEILSTNTPEDVETLQQAITRLKIWQGLNDNVKWSRLYGGSLAVLLIDGQDPATPLRIETVGRDKFKGLMVLDRWMVEPDLQRLVKDYGPHLGLPEWYRVVSDAPAMRNQRIHYTRCIRLEGIRLPYWQRIMENLWGLSVFERLYDRMVAFDSATQGAAQLVYKSYIRTYAIDGLQEAAATGGDALVGIARRVEQMRKYQGIEGITLIDGKDKFEGHQVSSFTGISDALLQFAQQLSGALQIPMVRLFGQSPAGLNATGESDLRTYYDNILQMQERDMREGMNVILRVLALSLGIELPKEFSFKFVPLWQLNETEKSEVADRDSKFILEVEAAGLISARTALQELKALAPKTGRWTNITEEMIDQASDVAEPPEAGGEEGSEGQPGAQPGAMPGAQPGAEGAPNSAAKLNGKGPPTGEGEGAASLEGLEKLRTISRAVGKDRALDQYSLPFTEIGGLQIVVEQRAGTIRSGENWAVVMPADYGHCRRIPSAEGATEWLDCFCGNKHSSRDVWIIDALNPHTGKFDETKLMLGFDNSREAVDCFKKAYDDGAAKRIGAVSHLQMDSLRWKNWIADDGNKTKPFASLDQMRSAA